MVALRPIMSLRRAAAPPSREYPQTWTRVCFGEVDTTMLRHVFRDVGNNNKMFEAELQF